MQKSQPKQSQGSRESSTVPFSGRDAVNRVLGSAGMRATKIAMIAMCRGMMGSIWEADTDRGKRWVSHSDSGWKISKTPPSARDGVVA